ncbi:hypothetical protein PHYSODRAFT_333191 [Phytophthora sojae]|uniref:RxLR effector protein n=1 Tax=Phytophthora sojae (strain P6497) TaxID=1094619 RepID=G4ZKW7_PHYSP|nr:hypothetical protein PHYSODRAFT_333191 [Phytophthora sojae]EGZ14885.1 hypothetical protein PHYSODRAFT_333191 [Phytophthora sojae]|eukprot:XP_009528634.1 hypothetical protein PHYSODRAFT_333191 [Phytophthora sojae]
MQFVKTLVIAAIATTLCRAPANVLAEADTHENTPNIRKLYYSKIPQPPTPSPAANDRKLYYTKIPQTPTPSPVVSQPAIIEGSNAVYVTPPDDNRR